MYNPTARMWDARLAPPPPALASNAHWAADWDEYCDLYASFELVRREYALLSGYAERPDVSLELDATRAVLKDAINALAACNYVHGDSARAIQTDGALRTSMVSDITQRHCVLTPPRAERVHWCDDGSVNLNVQEGRMHDMSAARDGAGVLEGVEPMDTEQSCIYLTRDPRRTYTYAHFLWQVANQ